jgi:hypothetical protein
MPKGPDGLSLFFAEQPQRLRALKLARSFAPTHKLCDASYKADTNYTVGAKVEAGRMRCVGNWRCAGINGTTMRLPQASV